MGCHRVSSLAGKLSRNTSAKWSAPLLRNLRSLRSEMCELTRVQTTSKRWRQPRTRRCIRMLQGRGISLSPKLRWDPAQLQVAVRLTKDSVGSRNCKGTALGAAIAVGLDDLDVFWLPDRLAVSGRLRWCRRQANGFPPTGLFPFSWSFPTL